MQKNDWLGWLLRDNPHFWEDQGFHKATENINYYGCSRAEINKYPIYRKTLAICSDMEDWACVEVFACDYGVIKHSHLVAISTWNASGGSKYPLDAIKQVSTIHSYNEFIKDYGLDNLEDNETFLISLDKEKETTAFSDDIVSKSSYIKASAFNAGWDAASAVIINKAVKYLLDHKDEVQTEDNGIAGWIPDKFIMDFKQAME